MLFSTISNLCPAQPICGSLPCLPYTQNRLSEGILHVYLISNTDYMRVFTMSTLYMYPAQTICGSLPCLPYTQHRLSAGLYHVYLIPSKDYLRVSTMSPLYPAQTICSLYHVYHIPSKDYMRVSTMSTLYPADYLRVSTMSTLYPAQTICGSLLWLPYAQHRLSAVILVQRSTTQSKKNIEKHFVMCF